MFTCTYTSMQCPFVKSTVFCFSVKEFVHKSYHLFFDDKFGMCLYNVHLLHTCVIGQRCTLVHMYSLYIYVSLLFIEHKGNCE